MLSIKYILVCRLVVHYSRSISASIVDKTQGMSMMRKTGKCHEFNLNLIIE